MLPWRSGHWRQALRARAVAATRFASCQKVLPHLGLVPRAVRVAVLWNSSIQAKVAEWKDTQEPARSVGLTLRSFEARSPEELDGVLAAIGHDLPDALLTFTDGFMIALRHPLDRILFEQCSNLIECHVRRMSTRRSARQPRGTCRARSRRTRSSRPYRRRLAASLTNVLIELDLDQSSPLLSVAFFGLIRRSRFTGRGVPSMCDYSLHNVATRPARSRTS